ncbi:MBOAT family O-acyltransferase [Neptunitalea lumnitzerae]|uniref:O-acyltransferase n=1 Tax=Neptunitalea lumnitzerae TaxID=2965509 RepID=A0ABQ5MEZ7_9FLAO|nr:MBOAT family O-acyltransferase [Neptunitalea sp. Y10]GLB47932.1 O-acyltransferase [Neptunitalea sp. Y10]
MLFHSITFLVFLPIVFILYWYITNNNLKLQNVLILIASYVFYGWWDYRFLALIVFSTVVDFICGLQIHKTSIKSKRKLFMCISLIANLGLLGFFKYYNFFIESFVEAFSNVGVNIEISTLYIILPVGISFYTFQTLSYTIDIYKERLKPTSDFIAFASFVSFFPQLVAGPIERASNLLPQFFKKRTFDYAKATDGLRQMLWGFFKKMVVADNCAQIANDIFNNSDSYNGSTLVIGALMFTFQIYADFSGYSDIAIGCARLFGFNLRQNFAYPYFSRDFAEAWRRWHISLTTWFRDYLFIPIIRLWKKHKWVKVPVIFLQFIIIGFWHGANWTFFYWGLLQACYFIPTIYKKSKKPQTKVVAQGKFFPSPIELLKVLRVFTLVCFSMIFFRATSVSQAFGYIGTIFSSSLFEKIQITSPRTFTTTSILVGIFFLVEWLGREDQYAIEKIVLKWKRPLRFVFYYAIIATIFIYKGEPQEYIYFNF